MFLIIQKKIYIFYHANKYIFKLDRLNRSTIFHPIISVFCDFRMNFLRNINDSHSNIMYPLYIDKTKINWIEY